MKTFDLQDNYVEEILLNKVSSSFYFYDSYIETDFSELEERETGINYDDLYNDFEENFFSIQNEIISTIKDCLTNELKEKAAEIFSCYLKYANFYNEKLKDDILCSFPDEHQYTVLKHVFSITRFYRQDFINSLFHELQPDMDSYNFLISHEYTSDKINVLLEKLEHNTKRNKFVNHFTTQKTQIIILNEMGFFENPYFESATLEKKGEFIAKLLNMNFDNAKDYIGNKNFKKGGDKKSPYNKPAIESAKRILSLIDFDLNL